MIVAPIVVEHGVVYICVRVASEEKTDFVIYEIVFENTIVQVGTFKPKTLFRIIDNVISAYVRVANRKPCPIVIVA